MNNNSAKIPVHQWTNESGEVLILRFVGKDGKAFGGFPHPSDVGAKLTVPEEWNDGWGKKPDDWKAGWDASASYGGGIHGWPWGLGLGDVNPPEWDTTWQVYGATPQDVVGEIDGAMKCKFREGTLRYNGDLRSALMFILDGQKKWVEHFADGASSATDNSSASAVTGLNGKVRAGMVE